MLILLKQIMKDIISVKKLIKKLNFVNLTLVTRSKVKLKDQIFQLVINPERLDLFGQNLHNIITIKITKKHRHCDS